MERARIANANATESVTFFDEWVRLGVRHVVVSPGSRSTPLALAAAAAAERGDIDLHVHIDERCAAFMALGIGAATGTPAVLVCTSGTAAANFAPAVIEAGLSAVPMIVATADRPPELRGRGAPQTIDQVDLYGGAVVHFVDVVPPDDGDPAGWRPLARDAFIRSGAGPVHLNVCFREPLVGVADALPPQLSTPAPTPDRPVTPDTEPVPDIAATARRGLIVAGGRSLVGTDIVVALSERLGWPILADPLSGLRSHPNSVTAFDPILRSVVFANQVVPDIVVRFGRPPASRVANEWIRDSGCPVIQVGGPGRVDPDHTVTAYCDEQHLDAVGSSAEIDPSWLTTWQAANRAAEQAIAASLGTVISEPGVARVVAESIGDDARLVVSSSMPVRELESFGGPSATAFANRGANGIDGVVSTALGFALSGARTTVLIGDLAMCHDTNALLGLATRNVQLTIVVVDNGGGGIFSFLPQARELSPETFELLFGTPSGADIAAMARAHGIAVSEAGDLAELGSILATEPGGSRLVLVRGDRSRNYNDHVNLYVAVSAAISAAVGTG